MVFEKFIIVVYFLGWVYGGGQYCVDGEYVWIVVLQYCVQDVWGVDEQVGLMVVGEFGYLVVEFGEFLFGCVLGEIVVGLCEVEFGQFVLVGGWGESFGQEQYVGVDGFYLCDQLGLEVGWFGVGIVDVKEFDVVVNLMLYYVQYFVVQVFGIVVEVEWIDVLVFFWWIFCVGDGVVWQFGELLLVFVGLWMIWCVLQCQVQCDFYVQIVCCGDEVVEVVDGVQVGMNGIVIVFIVIDCLW